MPTIRTAERWPALPYPTSVEADLRDVASVDPDRRQDTPDARTVAQPLLARPALCDRTRPDHLADAHRKPGVPDRFRLHRPPALGEHQRCPPDHAGPQNRGGVLRRGDGSACRTQARHTDHDITLRDRRRHRLRQGRRPRAGYSGAKATPAPNARGKSKRPGHRRCRAKQGRVWHRASAFRAAASPRCGSPNPPADARARWRRH